MQKFEEYKTMSEANFNLVLHQESRFAAEDFNDRLKIPFIELRRLYQTDKIQNQYQPWGLFWAFLLIQIRIAKQRSRQ